MSATDLPTRIRRILVGLDASAASLAALEAATTLAARMNAELLGLFVEDVNLLRLAGLPFASEVGMLSARTFPLETQGMEQRLRAQAERAQRALARVAGRRQVRWTFRVARGQIVAELLTAAEEADLIALGTANVQAIRRARLGSTVQAVMNRAVHPLLILPGDVTIRTPICVIYDGSTSSTQALTLAGDLAQADDGELAVFVLADDPEAEQRLRAAAAARLEPIGLKVRYRWLVEADPRTLVHSARRERIGTLVFAADGATLGRETMRDLLARVDCAVLLLR